MSVEIRRFMEEDIPKLVEILKLNGQYDYPQVEGPESMRRVSVCDAAVFLVAEEKGQPCGFVKAVYDGSRAMIHLLSVHPDHQRSGIGSALLEAVSDEFLRRGAPTMSAIVTEESVEFWKKQGFNRLPVFLMLRNSE